MYKTKFAKCIKRNFPNLLNEISTKYETKFPKKYKTKFPKYINTDDVEAMIRTLLPSTNVQLTLIQVTQTKEMKLVLSRPHGTLDMPERRYPENAERFVPIIGNMLPRNG